MLNVSFCARVYSVYKCVCGLHTHIHTRTHIHTIESMWMYTCIQMHKTAHNNIMIVFYNLWKLCILQILYSAFEHVLAPMGKWTTDDLHSLYMYIWPHIVCWKYSMWYTFKDSIKETMTLTLMIKRQFSCGYLQVVVTVFILQLYSRKFIPVGNVGSVTSTWMYI